MTNLENGYITNEIYKVEAFGNTFKLINTNGEKVGTLGIGTSTRKRAFEQNQALQAYVNKNGKKTYRRVDIEKYNNLVAPLPTDTGGVQHEENQDHEAIKNFIHDGSLNLKPRELVMSELKWKYLIRSAVRARNIMG